MAKTRALLVATSVLLVATVLAVYAGHILFNSGQFADRATSALRDPNVRAVVADRITDELVLPSQPDLLAARPIVISAVSGVVGGNAFSSLFRRGVGDVHRAVFQRDQDTATLTLVDVGTVVSVALRALRPELADQIESDRRVVLLQRDIGGATGDVARIADDVRIFGWILAALTLATAVATVLTARDRRDAIARLGVAAAIAGVVIVAAEIVAKGIVLDRVAEPYDRAATVAVWEAFLGDLRTTGWLIAACGAVVAAAAASLIRPIEAEERLMVAWRAVTREPESKPLRAVRGVAFVVVGALVIADPLAAVRIAATLVGVYALYKGIEALLLLINRPEAAERSDIRFRRLAVPLVAVVLIGVAITTFFAAGGADEPAVATTGGCNGHEELCDRRLDDVTLPATHNAMSVPLPGWFSSLQGRPIDRQLRDGVRGLLLDTHYADKLPDGRTRTYFSDREDLRQAIEQDSVSEAGVAAAERLRGRLGFRGQGEHGMYLCHTFCEIGSTPLGDVLDDIHEFLVTHPGDVLMIINQDYVSPKDFVGAMDAAGLSRYALTPPAAGAQWPTLGEMVEQDKRLVVLAENEAGAASWYQLAYQRLTKETPFEFKGTAQLTDPQLLPASCRPNRGPETAPLFLVNHWVNTDPLPLPSNASVVNAYAPLLRRAQLCQTTRKARVNLLAVDFYERGDVFKVADTLNGL